MREEDDAPRRTDPRRRLVAIVLVVCLVITLAPVLASLIF